MKDEAKLALGVAGGLAAAGLTGLAVTGREIGWGPFRGLFKGYEEEIRAIEQRYDAGARKGEIVFYGASNFRLWKDMEADLAPYPVQNHGFGGSTDKDLVRYAGRILFPYEPRIVVFQTASNDYVSLEGTEEEKLAACMAYKEAMFDSFHRRLPRARFLVLGSLLLPGRSRYTPLAQEVNRRLAELCRARGDYMTFVDSESLTFDGADYRTELFIRDGIHLTHEGQLLWRDGYILPALQALEKGGAA